MNSAVPDRRINSRHLWDGLSRSPIPVCSEPASGSLRLLRVGRSVGDDPLELADRLVLQVEPGGADGEVVMGTGSWGPAGGRRGGGPPRPPTAEPRSPCAPRGRGRPRAAGPPARAGRRPPPARGRSPPGRAIASPSRDLLIGPWRYEPVLAELPASAADGQ